MSPHDEVAVLMELASEQLGAVPSLAAAYREVTRTPYEYRPGDVHVRWEVARRRGYAACGEAAAYLAAAAAREGRSVAIQLVTGPVGVCGPSYRHAVVVVDGEVLDPYSARACAAPHTPLATRYL